MTSKIIKYPVKGNEYGGEKTLLCRVSPLKKSISHRIGVVCSSHGSKTTFNPLKSPLAVAYFPPQKETPPTPSSSAQISSETKSILWPCILPGSHPFTCGGVDGWVSSMPARGGSLCREAAGGAASLLSAKGAAGSAMQPLELPFLVGGG